MLVGCCYGCSGVICCCCCMCRNVCCLCVYWVVMKWYIIFWLYFVCVGCWMLIGCSRWLMCWCGGMRCCRFVILMGLILLVFFGLICLF